MAIKAFKSKAPKEKLDPRTAQNSVKMKDRLDRATEAHRMIPITSFVSDDYHVLVTTRGDLVALWECEGIDSSCLSKEEIESHHTLITQAFNESNGKLMVHQYFVKDQVAYDKKPVFNYQDEVINGIDGAQYDVLSKQTQFATRIVYCMEWKTPFVAATGWIQKLKPMLGDICFIWKAEARDRLKNRINYLLGTDEPAVEASERLLLLEIRDFLDAAEGFLARMSRLNLGDSIDQSAAEGVGAASLGFVKIKGVEAYDFFSRLWNWDHIATPFLPSPSHLAHYIASKNEVDCGRFKDVIVSGEVPLAIYTVNELRDPVEYDVFKAFRTLPIEMVIHTRFVPMGIDESSAYLSGKITTAHRMGGWVKGDPQRKYRMEELEQALAGSVRGAPFGWWSGTIVIAGKDLEDLAIKRRMVEQAGSVSGVFLRRESMNIDFTWLSLWPNNHVFEFNRLAGQTSLASGALMPYRMPEGYGKRAPSGQAFPEPLCTLNAWTPEGGTGYPTRVWIGVADLNHFLITGRSGQGKSFLVNFLVTNWGRYAGTKTQPHRLKRWIIDRGHSYAPLCEVLNGSYLNVGDPNSPAKMNPLDMSSKAIRQNIDKLVPFICMLMTATATGNKIEFNESDTACIARALGEMATDMERLSKRGSIRLLANSLKGATQLYQRLLPWIPTEAGSEGGGEFAHIFPDDADGFINSDFVVFNFSDEFTGPSTLGPIMSYILMKLDAYVMDPQNVDEHKLLFVDELAIFITPKPQDWKSEQITGTLRGMIRKAIKEWRKASGAIGLATQEPRDLLFDEGLFETVRMGVPTKIYIQQDPTKALTDKEAGFGVDPHLGKLLKDLGKGVFLMEQRGMKRFLQLKPDKTSYAIYTTDPAEKVFRKGYLAAHPITEDNNALKVFSEIGEHIQLAKASGTRVKYLLGIAKKLEL